MSEAILKKMEAKLERMEKEFLEMFSNNPAEGHGGTPHILDNSKGRRMYNNSVKREERLIAKDKAIKEQKEKIERMENRISLRSIQTKASKKRLEKNPISQSLIDLEARGLVKQWVRNPDYFFINGLNKVALVTRGGKVCVSSRFPVTTFEEREKVIEILGIKTGKQNGIL